MAEPPEQCDDGNAVPGDGCGPDCRFEQPLCGDGIVDFPEECDDLNGIDTDPCRNDCTFATCGDGVVCENAHCISGPFGGREECDDGNVAPGDGCGPDCGLEQAEDFCGDGYLLPDLEDCDDGNDEPDDGCFACELEWCGRPINAGYPITASDALRGLQVSVLPIAEKFAACHACICDVNGDGDVTAGDALAMLVSAVNDGRSDRLRCGCCPWTHSCPPPKPDPLSGAD